MERYVFIAEQQKDYPVQRLCQTMQVSVSGFYAWKQRGESPHAQEDGRLKKQIREIFQRHAQRYGSPRVHAELQARGVVCSRKRIARLMRQEGFSACRKRGRKGTTVQREQDEKAENLLAQDFHAIAPNEKWVADITAIWTQEGWLYVAGMLDLFSRTLIGWAMGAVQDEHLVERAFLMAVQRRKPCAGLLHHSDRGCQYTSRAYQQLLAQWGVKVSMSRTGNCYDNAPMESFWATLKQECVLETVFVTRRLAQHAIFHYIEAYYNHQRRHSSLGYLSPTQYEGVMT